MSTTKISQLPQLDTLNANSSNTLFLVLDLPSGVDATKTITGRTLAQGLYAYESLNVGGTLFVSNNTGIGTNTPSSKLHVIGTTTSNVFSSTIATGNAPFIVVSTTPVANLVANTVVTNANLTGEVTSIGNITTVNNAAVILKTLTNYTVANGTISSSDSILSSIQKLDGNIQQVTNNVIDANTFLQANDGITLSSAKSYTDSSNTFLQANDGITLSSAKSYTDTANTWLQANDAITLNTAIAYINAANTWLQANDAITLNTAKSYTDSVGTDIRVFATLLSSNTLLSSVQYTDVANTFLQANDGITLNTAIAYTDTANTWLRANDGITLNTSITYTNSANVYLTGLINYQSTNRFYVDPARTDTYTATGSLNKPFKTVSDALTYIHAGIDGATITSSEINPIFVILKGSTSESITLSRGHIFLVGENGNQYTNITVNGTISVDGSNTSTNALNTNYFVVSGLTITGGTNNNCLQTSGANAQSLFVKDVTINASGTGNGVFANNSGTLSLIQGSDIRVSHTGTGDVYCFNINKGNAVFSHVQTISATQIGAVQNGASLKFINSELEANGTSCLESYGTGVLTAFNTSITNYQTSANSYGVWLHDSGSTAIIDQCYFDIRDTTHSGSRALKGVSGSIVSYSNLAFAANTTLGSTNNLLDSSVTFNLLTNSFTRV